MKQQYTATAANAGLKPLRVITGKPIAIKMIIGAEISVSNRGPQQYPPHQIGHAAMKAM
jgi:hypothetical protein